MNEQHGEKSGIPAHLRKQRVVVRNGQTGEEREIAREQIDYYLNAPGYWRRIDPDPGLTGYETTPADPES